MGPPLSFRYACLLVLFCSMTACSEAGDRYSSHTSTAAVAAAGAGQAVEFATLTEELLIDGRGGSDGMPFVMIAAVAPDGRGGVFVFDNGVPTLRQFDERGRYRRTVGHQGSGPGGYGEGATGLALHRDGRLLLCDARNARITVFDSTGQPADQWRIPSGLFVRNPVVADTAGDVYVKVALGRVERGRPLPVGLLHLSSSGAVVDTLPVPRITGEPTALPELFGFEKLWEMSPVGDLIIGVNSDYAFEIRRRDGRVIEVERPYDPVLVNPEEWTALIAGRRQNLTVGMEPGQVPEMPRVKPAYRGIDVGIDGRIWIRLHSIAERVPGGDPTVPPGVSRAWREPTLYDIFESDGTYVGRVRLPDGVRLVGHGNGEVWGVVAVGLDEQNLIRYRLEFAGR